MESTSESIWHDLFMNWQEMSLYFFYSAVKYYVEQIQNCFKKRFERKLLRGKKKIQENTLV